MSYRPLASRTSSDSRDATADTLPGCASTTKTSSLPSMISATGGAPPGARWYGQCAFVRTQMPQCCGGPRVSRYGERRVAARERRLRRRVAATTRLDGRRAPTGWHAKKQRAHVSGTSSSHGHAMLFTTQ